MNVVYNGVSTGVQYLRKMYNQLNPATLTGAIDILVIEQPDGSLLASPFHVRFGKIGVINIGAKELKLVDIAINDQHVEHLQMKLGSQGEAFFVVDIGEEESIPPRMITSPLPSRPSTPRMMNLEQENECDDLDITPDGKGRKRKKLKTRRERSMIHSPQQDSDVINPEDDDDVNNNTKEFTTTRSSPCLRSDKWDIPVIAYSKTDISDCSSSNSSTTGGTYMKQSRKSLDHDFRTRCVLSDSDIPSAINETLSKEEGRYKSHEDEINRVMKVSWGWGELPRNDRASESSSSSTDEPLLDHVDISQSDPIDGVTCFTDTNDEQAAADAPTTAAGYHEDTHFRAISDEVSEEAPICPPSTDHETEAGSSKTSTAVVTATTAAESTTDVPKSRKRNITDGGMYLEEILSLDPTEADLYLKAAPKDEVTVADVTGELPGTGSSSVRATSPSGGSDIDSGTDCLNTEDPNDIECHDTDVTISLCGFEDNQVNQDRFLEKQVAFESFQMDPFTFINDPNLVVRIGGHYLNWQNAQPAIMALAVFKRPLSMECLDRIMQPPVSEQPQQGSRLMGWFWRSSKKPQASNGTVSTPSSPSKLKTDTPTPPPSTIPDDDNVVDEEISEIMGSAATNNINNSCNRRGSTMSEGGIPTTDHKPVPPPAPTASSSSMPGKSMRKTTRLTSEQLKTLNLQPGANTITFSVTTKYQGTSKCNATIYLWNCTDRIVISDVDGTITKSDALGHILPAVGKDWTQRGIAQLYQNIAKNGYKFIYVSSRAIGQASMTKEYLKWVDQHGVGLPPGPLLVSPSSLMMALHREVIEKKPEKFKIECLKDISALFKENPFVAGFGNKANDVVAYSTAGIPRNRIFIVNHRGELKHEKMPTYSTTYSDFGQVVNNFFPYLGPSLKTDLEQAQDYSDFTFWKMDNFVDYISDSEFDIVFNDAAA